MNLLLGRAKWGIFRLLRESDRQRVVGVGQAACTALVEYGDTSFAIFASNQIVLLPCGFSKCGVNRGIMWARKYHYQG